VSISGEFGIEVEVLVVSKFQVAQLPVRVGWGAICESRTAEKMRGEKEKEGGSEQRRETHWSSNQQNPRSICTHRNHPKPTQDMWIKMFNHFQSCHCLVSFQSGVIPLHTA